MSAPSPLRRASLRRAAVALGVAAGLLLTPAFAADVPATSAAGPATGQSSTPAAPLVASSASESSAAASVPSKTAAFARRFSMKRSPLPSDAPPRPESNGPPNVEAAPAHSLTSVHGPAPPVRGPAPIPDIAPTPSAAPVRPLVAVPARAPEPPADSVPRPLPGAGLRHGVFSTTGRHGSPLADLARPVPGPASGPAAPGPATAPPLSPSLSSPLPIPGSPPSAASLPSSRAVPLSPPHVALERRPRHVSPLASPTAKPTAPAAEPAVPAAIMLSASAKPAPAKLLDASPPAARKNHSPDAAVTTSSARATAAPTTAPSAPAPAPAAPTTAPAAPATAPGPTATAPGPASTAPGPAAKVASVTFTAPKAATSKDADAKSLSTKLSVPAHISPAPASLLASKPAPVPAPAPAPAQPSEQPDSPTPSWPTLALAVGASPSGAAAPASTAVTAGAITVASVLGTRTPAGGSGASGTVAVPMLTVGHASIAGASVGPTAYPSLLIAPASASAPALALSGPTPKSLKSAALTLPESTVSAPAFQRAPGAPAAGFFAPPAAPVPVMHSRVRRAPRPAGAGAGFTQESAGSTVELAGRTDESAGFTRKSASVTEGDLQRSAGPGFKGVGANGSAVGATKRWPSGGVPAGSTAGRPASSGFYDGLATQRPAAPGAPQYPARAPDVPTIGMPRGGAPEPSPETLAAVAARMRARRSGGSPHVARPVDTAPPVIAADAQADASVSVSATAFESGTAGPGMAGPEAATPPVVAVLSEPYSVPFLARPDLPLLLSAATFILIALSCVWRICGLRARLTVLALQLLLALPAPLYTRAVHCLLRTGLLRLPRGHDGARSGAGAALTALTELTAAAAASVRGGRYSYLPSYRDREPDSAADTDAEDTLGGETGGDKRERQGKPLLLQQQQQQPVKTPQQLQQQRQQQGPARGSAAAPGTRGRGARGGGLTRQQQLARARTAAAAAAPRAGRAVALSALARGAPSGAAAAAAAAAAGDDEGFLDFGDGEDYSSDGYGDDVFGGITGNSDDDADAYGAHGGEYVPDNAAVALARIPVLTGVPAAAVPALAAPPAAEPITAASQGADPSSPVAGLARTLADSASPPGSPGAAAAAPGSSSEPHNAPTDGPLSLARFPASSPQGRTLLNSPLLLRRAVAALPPLYAASDWRLLFALGHRGADLAALYRAAAGSAPVLLVVKDSTGAVAAALLPDPLRPAPGFTGGPRGWVAQLWPRYAVYKPTGANRFYVHAARGALAVGGGDNHALWFDEGLRTVTSGPCRTFASPQLIGADTATVYGLELWGFVPPGTAHAAAPR